MNDNDKLFHFIIIICHFFEMISPVIIYHANRKACENELVIVHNFHQNLY